MELRAETPAEAEIQVAAATPASVEQPAAGPVALPVEADIQAAAAVAQVSTPAAADTQAALVLALTRVWNWAATARLAAATAEELAVIQASPPEQDDPTAQASLRGLPSFPGLAGSAPAWLRLLARVSCQELAPVCLRPAVSPLLDENPPVAARVPNAYRSPAGFPLPSADAHGSRWQTAPDSASPSA